MEQAQDFKNWCIVELFGHQKIAGLVMEAQIGGCNFIRVDVPEVNGQPAFTRFYGNGAIYSITPVSEEIARAALNWVRPRPVEPYMLPAPAARDDDWNETWPDDSPVEEDEAEVTA